MKTAPVFEMRGLCYGTSFDRHFGWTGVWDPDTEQYSFPGFSKSMLQVDNFQKVPFVHLFREKFNINFTCHESTHYSQSRHGWQGPQGLGLAWILQNRKRLRQRWHATEVTATVAALPLKKWPWRPCL